jgi:hypothetical protein
MHHRERAAARPLAVVAVVFPAVAAAVAVNCKVGCQQMNFYFLTIPTFNDYAILQAVYQIVVDSVDRFSIPAAAKNPELATDTKALPQQHHHTYQSQWVSRLYLLKLPLFLFLKQ